MHEGVRKSTRKGYKHKEGNIMFIYFLGMRCVSVREKDINIRKAILCLYTFYET